MSKITFNNFFLDTIAVFKGCKKPVREPDYISYASEYWGGKVSSSYWYGSNSKGSYVIRESNHWVNRKPLNSNKVTKDCASIATCKWNIKGKEVLNMTKGKCSYEYKPITAKCYLKDFSCKKNK